MSEKESSTYEWLKSNALSLFYAFLIAFFIRSFLFQAFFIPTSSMEPNLLIGDRLFASKYTYGYSNHSLPFSPPLIEDRIFFNNPKRGDVIIFKPPHENRDFIKRLVGLPGDTIQMIDSVLYINNEEIKRVEVRKDQTKCGEATVYLEKLPSGLEYETYQYESGFKEHLETKTFKRNGKKISVLVNVCSGDNNYLDNTEIKIVPEGSYFFMGDNRDRSSDSRVWEKFIVLIMLVM